MPLKAKGKKKADINLQDVPFELIRDAYADTVEEIERTTVKFDEIFGAIVATRPRNFPIQSDFQVQPSALTPIQLEEVKGLAGLLCNVWSLGKQLGKIYPLNDGIPFAPPALKFNNSSSAGAEDEIDYDGNENTDSDFESKGSCIKRLKSQVAALHSEVKKIRVTNAALTQLASEELIMTRSFENRLQEKEEQLLQAVHECKTLREKLSKLCDSNGKAPKLNAVDYPPNKLIGSYVYKKFSSGYFFGKIKRFNPPDDYFVVFEDADMEEVSRRELLSILWTDVSTIPSHRKLHCDKHVAASYENVVPLITAASQRVEPYLPENRPDLQIIADIIQNGGSAADAAAFIVTTTAAAAESNAGNGTDAVGVQQQGAAAVLWREGSPAGEKCLSSTSQAKEKQHRRSQIQNCAKASKSSSSENNSNNNDNKNNKNNNSTTCNRSELNGRENNRKETMNQQSMPSFCAPSSSSSSSSSGLLHWTDLAVQGSKAEIRIRDASVCGSPQKKARVENGATAISKQLNSQSIRGFAPSAVVPLSRGANDIRVENLSLQTPRNSVVGTASAAASVGVDGFGVEERRVERERSSAGGIISLAGSSSGSNRNSSSDGIRRASGYGSGTLRICRKEVAAIVNPSASEYTRTTAVATASLARRVDGTGMEPAAQLDNQVRRALGISFNSVMVGERRVEGGPPPVQLPRGGFATAAEDPSDTTSSACNSSPSSTPDPAPADQPESASAPSHALATASTLTRPVAPSPAAGAARSAGADRVEAGAARKEKETDKVMKSANTAAGEVVIQAVGRVQCNQENRNERSAQQVDMFGHLSGYGTLDGQETAEPAGNVPPPRGGITTVRIGGNDPGSSISRGCTKLSNAPDMLAKHNQNKRKRDSASAGTGAVAGAAVGAATVKGTGTGTASRAGVEKGPRSAAVVVALVDKNEVAGNSVSRAERSGRVSQGGGSAGAGKPSTLSRPLARVQGQSSSAAVRDFVIDLCETSDEGSQERG